MANNTREQLEKRVQKAILQESYLRWESAVVIALTLGLAVAAAFDTSFVNFIPPWGWLLGGALAEITLVFSSLTDPEFGSRVASSLLHSEFQPERLNDKGLQKQVKKALDYRSRINLAIRSQNNSLLKDELSQTASQIDDWLENIYDLAQRIDRYRKDLDILSRDYKHAQTRATQLHKQLEQESDLAIKTQIQKTLAGNQKQLDTLESLDNTIQRAELQLENSLIHLGTIYSQTMLVDAKDIDSGRSRRLRQEIEEEVTEINDVLLAIDEVHSAELLG